MKHFQRFVWALLIFPFIVMLSYAVNAQGLNTLADSDVPVVRAPDVDEISQFPLIINQSDIENPYVLKVGDVIQVRVSGEDDLSGLYSIGEQGDFVFPMIGRIVAQGHSVEDVSRILESRLLDGYLVDPEISVVVKNNGF